MGHGEKLTSFYAARLFLLTAVMYVDDTDLLRWGNSPDTKNGDLITQVQSTTNDFPHLVQATYGALKPSTKVCVLSVIPLFEQKNEVKSSH